MALFWVGCNALFSRTQGFQLGDVLQKSRNVLMSVSNKNGIANRFEAALGVCSAVRNECHFARFGAE